MVSTTLVACLRSPSQLIREIRVLAMPTSTRPADGLWNVEGILADDLRTDSAPEWVNLWKDGELEKGIGKKNGRLGISSLLYLALFVGE